MREVLIDVYICKPEVGIANLFTAVLNSKPFMRAGRLVNILVGSGNRVMLGTDKLNMNYVVLADETTYASDIDDPDIILDGLRTIWAIDDEDYGIDIDGETYIDKDTDTMYTYTTHKVIQSY